MIRELMVQEARLALAAFAAGNLARYAMHQGNARQLADHLALQEAQEQQRRERRSVYLAPGVVEGPDHMEDFLQKNNALSAALRWYVLPLIAIGLVSAAGYLLGRTLGWI